MKTHQELPLTNLSLSQTKKTSGGFVSYISVSSLVDPNEWIEAFEKVNEKWDEWKAEVSSGWDSCGCSY